MAGEKGEREFKAEFSAWVSRFLYSSPALLSLLDAGLQAVGAPGEEAPVEAVPRGAAMMHQALSQLPFDKQRVLHAYLIDNLAKALPEGGVAAVDGGGAGGSSSSSDDGDDLAQQDLPQSQWGKGKARPGPSTQASPDRFSPEQPARRGRGQRGGRRGGRGEGDRVGKCRGCYRDAKANCQHGACKAHCIGNCEAHGTKEGSASDSDDDVAAGTADGGGLFDDSQLFVALQGFSGGMTGTQSSLYGSGQAVASRQLRPPPPPPQGTAGGADWPDFGLGGYGGGSYGGGGYGGGTSGGMTGTQSSLYGSGQAVASRQLRPPPPPPQGTAAGLTGRTSGSAGTVTVRTVGVGTAAVRAAA